MVSVPSVSFAMLRIAIEPEKTLQQASTSGVQAFVGKPFDLQQLIDQTKQIAPV